MEHDGAKLVEEILATSIKNTGKIIAIDQTMLWQIVNFFILVWVFNRFLVKPVKGIIHKRHAKVTGEIETANKDKDDAAKLKVEADKELKQSRIEAQEILNEAIKKAE